MTNFFIERPIVAIVISIFMAMAGAVALLQLPVAQYPNIVPPEIQIKATYVGADALTVEQSVATPIEQQMSGVDNMNYMYSINANNGLMSLYVNFDVSTDPNTDQILAQMRESQAESQLPQDVRALGITVQKSMASPLVMFALYSPHGTYDNAFLANYAYININDKMLRVPGIATVTIFGAGQYAMRIWVKPDQLAKLNITIPDIISAVSSQSTVNPAGKIGGEPAPSGQEFTYAVRAQGRLTTPEEFASIIIRANPDGGIIRLGDVARIELGVQNYDMRGRLNGKPAALVALYQLPGTNAITAADGAKKRMQDIADRFPADMEYTIALDTTLPVTEGIKEISTTLIQALLLVILVVFVFLQGWRATLIPALAVPVALIGTFIVFPILGFSINTLSLFGLVLAIGLVVDDAIVVVEAVERHIENGLAPKDAAVKAMSEVSGPVIAIAIILAAVFIPTAFIPGITGSLYQQFAITIAVSVLISAFNALSLSPALAAMLLKPKDEKKKGPLRGFYHVFNKAFAATTTGYLGLCRYLLRKSVFCLFFIALAGLLVWVFASKIPSGFLPEEDQGYIFAGIQLPNAASMQRTSEAAKKVEQALAQIAGVQNYSTILGYNMLSEVSNSYSAFFFISFKKWDDRVKKDEQYAALMQKINGAISQIPDAIGFAFSPPAIPGIGNSGGVTFIVEDRSAKDMAFLAKHVGVFIAELHKRPEIANVISTMLPAVPQVFVDVDRDKVLKQGVDISDLYRTLQAYMGSSFVNYFNRFGRQWPVYLQAEGEYRVSADQLEQYYVRNSAGDMVPLSALTTVRSIVGPEFTMRYNLYRSAQVNVIARPGFSSAQVMKIMEDVFHATMPSEMGFDYLGMSFQEKKAQEGISPAIIFALSLLCVFLILAAQYESWSLPLSVLMATPIAVLGAFAGLFVRGMENNVYAQIGLVMLIGLSAKNAILIVEFAKAEHKKGKNLLDAALEGARLRLRPILMTSFAFILGCIPLAFASGAGKISRQIMGTTVIAGMLAATCIAIFLIPAAFYMVGKIKKQ